MIICFVSFVFCQMAKAQISRSDEILGTFKIERKGVEVMIYNEGGLYFGKTTNTTSQLPKGAVILKELIYDDGKWKGILFIAQLNRGFDCNIALDGSSSIKLDISFGFFKKSQLWHRLKK